MQTEVMAGLFGVGGALIGAAVSTGAVIWQQRKATHAAERSHLLGLSESAANECIRLSVAIQEFFEQQIDKAPSPEEELRSELRQLRRAVDEQSVRFADKDVRNFISRCQSKLFIASEDRWPIEDPQQYIRMCVEIREAMGAVLRRQPFPKWIERRHSPLPRTP